MSIADPRTVGITAPQNTSLNQQWALRRIGVLERSGGAAVGGGGGGGSTPDATPAIKGKLALASHLDGTADAPILRTTAAPQTARFGLSVAADSANLLTMGATGYLPGAGTAKSIVDDQGRNSVDMYNPGASPTYALGRRISISDGTETGGAYVTEERPSVKINRVQQVTAGGVAVGRANAMAHAALAVASRSSATDDTMIVGIACSAHQSSIVNHNEVDACAIVGQASTSGVGATGSFSAFGATLDGKRKTTDSRARGCEMTAGNEVPADIATYPLDGTGHSPDPQNVFYGSDFVGNNDMVGIHMCNKNFTLVSGTNPVANATLGPQGLGMSFSNTGPAAGGVPYDVGIGFLSGNNTGGVTGSCKTANISIEDNATTAIRIRGGNPNRGAIAIAPGSGRIGVGVLFPISALNLGYDSLGANSTSSLDGIIFGANNARIYSGAAGRVTIEPNLSVSDRHFLNTSGPYINAGTAGLGYLELFEQTVAPSLPGDTQRLRIYAEDAAGNDTVIKFIDGGGYKARLNTIKGKAHPYWGPPLNSTTTTGADTAPTVANDMFVVGLHIGAPCTITNLEYVVGSLKAGNVFAVLFDATGAFCASSASTAQSGAGASGSFHVLPIAQRINDQTGAPVAATTFNLRATGVYYVAIQFSSTGARFFSLNSHPIYRTGTARIPKGTFGDISTISPPLTYTAGQGPTVRTS